NPFKTPDTQRLAVLFGVVYFAQGMWYLPNQTITIVLKERGLSAGQVADFFLISTVPWLVKPLYGLISDFVPLFGRRRKSYFLVTSGLAALAGLLLASGSPISDGTIETLGVTLPIVGTVRFPLVAGAWLFTLMAIGLAFTALLLAAMWAETCGSWRASSSSGPSARPSARPSSTTRPIRSGSASSSSAPSARSARSPGSSERRSMRRSRGASLSSGSSMR